MAVGDHFAASYAQARAVFLAGARGLGVAVRSHAHPLKGVQGEELATDVARLGPANARALVAVSSGMHGVEGYCGSGCQRALMDDGELQARLAKNGVALLLVHAVNPYGFSHIRRTNEDNIDLNRNFIDFGQPLPVNAPYAEIHDLMLPAQWPPTEDNARRIREFVAEKGEIYFRDALSMGQTSHPDGLFYRGRAPAWSNTTLRSIMREHGAGCENIVWIDIHTGLGPRGHGEKIFASYDESLPARYDPAELARARAFWGADVFSIVDGQSASRNALGGGITALPKECPWARTTSVGLEFGTLARESVTLALRAEHWLHQRPQTDPSTRERIKRQLFEAFFIDSADWQGMVVAQLRVMVLQAVSGLAASAVAGRAAAQ